MSSNDKFILAGGDIVNADASKAPDLPTTPHAATMASEIPKTSDNKKVIHDTPHTNTIQWILKDEDLSPEELRTVQLTTTAFSKALYTNKDLIEEIVANGTTRAKREEIEELGPPPEPYYEIDSGLGLFMAERLPVGIMLVILGILVALLKFSGAQGWGLLGLVGGGLIVLTVNAYVIARTYKLWATTFRKSDHKELGFERKENGFFLIDVYNPTVPAADYKQGNPWRSQLLRALHINAWHADLDSISQNDDFLHNQKYVRDADRYKATAEANKNYALKIQGR